MRAKAWPRCRSTAARVLVIIPDGTRTMPMPMMFEMIERELGPRVTALDYLVALGTHTPMNDAQLSALVGRPVVNGRAGARKSSIIAGTTLPRYAHLGIIPARDIADLTGGRLREDVPGRAQPPCDRIRPRAHLRPGLSA